MSQKLIKNIIKVTRNYDDVFIDSSFLQREGGEGRGYKKIICLLAISLKTQAQIIVTF